MRNFKSINAKLFIPMGIIIILIFSVFALVLISHQNKSLIDKVYQDANLYSQLIEESIKLNMPINQRESIYKSMNLIAKQSRIKMIRMFDNRGKITFSTNEREVNNQVDMKAESCNICHVTDPPLETLTYEMRKRSFESEDETIFAFTSPIYNQSNCFTTECHAHAKEEIVLGTIDIGISMTDTQIEIFESEKIFILFTITTIIGLSVILFLFIHKFVTNPVKKLLTATKSIAKGNLDVRIQFKTKCEIGQLALSFNHMVKDLQKATNQINSWNIELERKVEERTSKLSLANAKLIQAEKMASMGILASSVAHEINNPLQGILTYIKLMLKIIQTKKVDKNRIGEFNNYLQLMRDEIARCGDMVKDLLIFSKQTKLNIKKADINNIIHNSLRLIENKIRLQNIKVQLNLEENIPKIQCDIKQIQQTIIALVINSIEAIQKDGKILIETRNIKGEFVEILIWDDGGGIEKEKLANIFDPFFTTKKNVKSTGLGLFVSYGIIKEHQGTIDVMSELGKGTKFYIKIPISGDTKGRNEE